MTLSLSCSKPTLESECKAEIAVAVAGVGAVGSLLSCCLHFPGQWRVVSAWQEAARLGAPGSAACPASPLPWEVRSGD